MLLCTTDENAPTIGDGGRGADACPDGEPFVRWEWNESQDQFVAEGDAAGTTMNATELNEDGEPVAAEWTSSEYGVSGAVVGAGQENCTYDFDDADSGTVETCNQNGGGTSNVATHAGTWSFEGSLVGSMLRSFPSGPLGVKYLPVLLASGVIGGAVRARRFS